MAWTAGPRAALLRDRHPVAETAGDGLDRIVRPECRIGTPIGRGRHRHRQPTPLLLDSLRSLDLYLYVSTTILLVQAAALAPSAMDAPESPALETWRRFTRHRVGVVALGVVPVLFALSFWAASWWRAVPLSSTATPLTGRRSDLRRTG